MNSFNGTKTIVDIAVVTSFTPLLATGPVRWVRGTESLLTSTGGANTLKGFDYQLLTRNDDGTITLGPWLAIAVPSATDGDVTVMELGDSISRYGYCGTMIGNGPSVIIGIGTTAATVLCNLRSATGSATSVLIEQYY